MAFRRWADSGSMLHAGWVFALEELAKGLLKSVCFRVGEFTLRLNAFRGKAIWELQRKIMYLPVCVRSIWSDPHGEIRGVGCESLLRASRPANNLGPLSTQATSSNGWLMVA